jgi:FlaA1/EpsC-like NDP-sugar epimerase
VLRIALGLAVVCSLIDDDVFGAVVIAVFFSLSFAYFLRDDRRPTVFDLLFALAALLVALGFVFGLFERVVPYNKLAHVFMTFAVSLAFFFLFYRDASPRWRAIAMATSVFTLGVSAGALWEIFEWSTGNKYSYSDTITDLLMDSAGALVAALVALAIHQRGGRIT